jgi:hypothetical protein
MLDSHKIIFPRNEGVFLAGQFPLPYKEFLLQLDNHHPRDYRILRRSPELANG